jgi:hypothetical protein
LKDFEQATQEIYARKIAENIGISFSPVLSQIAYEEERLRLYPPTSDKRYEEKKTADASGINKKKYKAACTVLSCIIGDNIIKFIAESPYIDYYFTQTDCLRIWEYLTAILIENREVNMGYLHELASEQTLDLIFEGEERGNTDAQLKNFTDSVKVLIKEAKSELTAELTALHKETADDAVKTELVNVIAAVNSKNELEKDFETVRNAKAILSIIKS